MKPEQRPVTPALKPLLVAGGEQQDLRLVFVDVGGKRLVFRKPKFLEYQSLPLFQKLQLLEHAFLSRSKNNQVIGTLPPLPDFVTVISQEIARPRASVRSRTVVVSWIYGPHNL